jgi:hypothetical protein
MLLDAGVHAAIATDYDGRLMGLVTVRAIIAAMERDQAEVERRAAEKGKAGPEAEARGQANAEAAPETRQEPNPT